MTRRLGALLWIATVLLCTVLLGSSLLRRPTWTRSIDIGAEGRFLAEGYTTTVRNFHGFHSTEWMDQGQRSFRWTEERAMLSVPFALREAPPLLVEVIACGCRLDGMPAQARLTINDHPAGTLTAVNEFRHYAILVPPDLGHPTYDLLISLHAPVWQGGDGRSLGLAIDRITLRQLSRQSLAQPVELLLAVVGVAVMAWRRRSLIFPVLLGGSWLAVVLLYQPQFLPRWVIMGELIAGLLLLWTVYDRGWRAIAASIASIWLVLSPQILGHWLLDDAYISFRYARHLIRGNGLVYNAGERVEGYTNFLWTIIAAAGMALAANPAVLTCALTLALAFVMLLLAALLMERITASPWALIAPALLLVSAPFLLYTTRGSGMETALFAALLLGSLLALIDGAWVLAGALTALTMLTRPDGIILAGVGGTYALLHRWQRGQTRLAPVLRYTAVVLAMFGPYFIWRWTYYGYLLPNTFYVKVGGTQAQVLRGAQYLLAFAWNQFILITAVLGALFASWRAGRHARSAGLLVSALVAAYSLYIVMVGGDWMPGFRFAVPLVPPLAVLTAWGVAELSRSAKWMHWPMGALMAGLFLLLALRLPQTSSFEPDSAIWIENDVVARYREVGRWIEAHMPPNTTIAVAAAGVLPFYADRPTIDVLGLNDEHIAHLPSSDLGLGKPGHEKTDPSYVLKRRPQIVPWVAAPYLTDHPEFAPNYRLEKVGGPEGRTIQLFVRRDVVLPRSTMSTNKDRR